jgi:hypothetical protein
MQISVGGIPATRENPQDGRDDQRQQCGAQNRIRLRLEELRHLNSDWRRTRRVLNRDRRHCSNGPMRQIGRPRIRNLWNFRRSGRFPIFLMEDLRMRDLVLAAGFSLCALVGAAAAESATPHFINLQGSDMLSSNVVGLEVYDNQKNDLGKIQDVAFDSS